MKRGRKEEGRGRGVREGVREEEERQRQREIDLVESMLLFLLILSFLYHIICDTDTLTFLSVTTSNIQFNSHSHHLFLAPSLVELRVLRPSLSSSFL